MNGLEKAFVEQYLRLRVVPHTSSEGRVHWWAFEPLRIRLGVGANYTPDFGVQARTGLFILYETKGFWKTDARLRIRLAAQAMPMFMFVGAQATQKRGAYTDWKFEEFKP